MMIAPETTSTNRGPWRIVVATLAGLILLGLTATGLALGLMRKPTREVTVGDATLRLVAEAHTGHQRAERLAFDESGSVLAVICPRYGRLVLFTVADGERLRPHRDVALGGRPVAIATTSDRFYVLERPAGDARHVEPAWWDTFDLAGNPVGPRVRVGFDPDDIALLDGGRTALVLLSGRAEGEHNRPVPSLVVYDLSRPDQPRPRGEVTFNDPKDDPERLLVSTRSDESKAPEALVSLRGSNTIARLDLSDLNAPRVIDRRPFPGRTAPGLMTLRADGTFLVAEADNSAVWAVSGEHVEKLADTIGTCVEFPSGQDQPFLIGLSERRSSLELLDENGRSVGRLTLGGFTGVRPLGLAIASQPHGDAHLAVCDRSGGVHLLAIEKR